MLAPEILTPEEEREARVNHPAHYTASPSGVEVIEITEHLNFCMGNAVKYILRADHKGDPFTDLHKAVWYLNREIARRELELNESVMEPLLPKGSISAAVRLGPGYQSPSMEEVSPAVPDELQALHAERVARPDLFDEGRGVE